MKIDFPKKLNTALFELILKENYHKSKLKKEKQIVFDLSSTIWFPIFELSQLSLWVYELIIKLKKVAVVLPNDILVSNFLSTYGFLEFLIEHKVKIENYTTTKIKTATKSLLKAPFYPLTFIDENEFKLLLNDLKYGKRMELIFNTIKECEIVKSGAIRDVVLYEVGNNIFEHSKNKFGNIVMSKYEVSVESNKLRWVKELEKNTTVFERDFFRKLEGEPYLELIISDKGKGIFKTLLKAYDEDKVINDKRDNPTEVDILKYSFLYHSTSRSLVERIKKIKDVISIEGKKFPPPTGLYSLIEIMREFQGLLYLRSGSSIVCYDFYKNQNNNIPKTNTLFKDFRKLTNFGGTQFKLLFPLEVPTAYFPYKARPNVKKLDYSTIDNINSEVINLKMLLGNNKLETLDQEADYLEKLFSEIDKKKCFYKKKEFLLILDGLKDIALSSKTLHYSILEISNRQDDYFTIVLINSDQKIVSQKNDNNHKIILKKILLVFDESSNVHYLGIDESYKQTFVHKISFNDTKNDKILDNIISKNKNLFIVDRTKRNYSNIYAEKVISHLYSEGLKKLINSIILDPNTLIFHKNIKVLLPSKYYCEGYFEAFKLFSNNTWKSIVTNYYSNIILQENPDFIISISSYCGKIIDDVIDKCKKTGYNLKCYHLNFKTPLTTLSYSRVVFEIKEGKSGIIITDVIGTGKTILSIIKSSNHITITKIMTFINASNSQRDFVPIQDKKIPIDSIIKYKLKYKNDLPPGWLYSDIKEVDTETHILVYNPVTMEGPIWKKISFRKYNQEDRKVERITNYFLADVIFPYEASEENHFISHEKHILYFFNIPKILKYLADEIAEVIVNDANNFIAKVTPPSKVTHVICPSYNPGLIELSNKVSLKFLKCLPLSVSYKEFISNYDQIEPTSFIDTAIIIDDAFESGDSIFRLLDIVERKGAKLIYVYILIKRGTDYNARKLEKITKFGHANVMFRYLGDVQLPMFHSSNCPVCFRIKELENAHEIIRDYQGLNFIYDFINSKKSKLTEQDIFDVVEESLFTSKKLPSYEINKKLEFRWKLELARTTASVRNELANVISTNKDHHELTLLLFSVISREKSYFLLDSKMKESIFYKSFLNNIEKACKYFIDNNELINDSDLESILEILDIIEPEILIDCLDSLLNSKALNKNKFLTICVQLLLSSKSMEYPSRIVKSLKQCIENIAKHEKFSGLENFLENVLLFWQERESQLIRGRNINVEIFKELDGAKFHNVNHHISSFIFDIKQIDNNYDSIIENWDYLQLEIKDSMRTLKTFIGINKRYDLVVKIEKIISKINYHILRGNEIIIELKEKNIKITNENIEIIKGELETIVNRISELIWEKKGAKDLVRMYSSNIKKVLQLAYEQYSDKLKTKGINVQRILTEDLCSVFCDKHNLLIVCQNLFENVYKHSQANILKILLNIDIENDDVILELIDNGKGMDRKVKFNAGLKIVDEIISFYNGTFELSPIDNQGLEYPDFSTKARIKLPHISHSIREVKVNE